MTGGFDLYGFAATTMFTVALAVFTFGVTYRLARFLFFWRRVPKASPRSRSSGDRIKGLITTFLHPIIGGLKKNPPDAIAGLLALHILGVIPLIFLMDHHIAAFDNLLPKIGPLRYSLLKPLSVPLSLSDSILRVQKGLALHTIWGPLVVILNGDVLAVMVLIGTGYKIGAWFVERARGAKNKRIGDLIALLLIVAIVTTGFLAAHHLLPDVWDYRLVLGLHILLAELLLMVLPFTKFWHFVFGYWYGKLHEWYELKIVKGVV